MRYKHKFSGKFIGSEEYNKLSSFSKLFYKVSATIDVETSAYQPFINYPDVDLDDYRRKSFDEKPLNNPHYDNDNLLSGIILGAVAGEMIRDIFDRSSSSSDYYDSSEDTTDFGGFDGGDFGGGGAGDDY